MRPLELTFSGLRSYRDTTTIDFSRLDLFAVIGDTGAGKSTIIEALSLALYAKKSWTGGPAALGDMIADGVNTMRIVLRFRADGHEWVVTRARHRNASAPVDKLTSPTGGGPNVDGARSVTERITELVGLDHDQFTRAVVLPQGRFDLLLRATESQRTEILSSILGLGDVAATRELVTATRDHWAEHAVVLGERRQRYPADPAAALAAAAAEALAADVRLAALTAAREAATGAERRATACQHRLDRLGRAIAAVPATPLDPAAELGELRDRAVVLHAERQRSADAAAAADAALATIESQVGAALAGFPTRDAMAAARASLAMVAESVDKDAARLSSLEDELAALGTAAPAAALDPALAATDAAARREVVAITARVSTAEQAARDARAAWQALDAARREVDARRLAVDVARGPTAALADAVAAAAAELVAAEHVVAAAADAERAALVDGAIAAAAAGCSPGDDCPVCARPLPSDFAAPAAPDQAGVARDRARAEEDVRRRRDRRDEAARAQHGAQLAVAAAERDLATATVAAEERAAVVVALGLDVACADETAALAPLVASVDGTRADLAAAEQRRDDAANALAVASARLDEARRSHQERLAAIDADLVDARSRATRHAAAVAAVPPSWRPALAGAAVEDVVARLDAAREVLDGLEGERAAAREAAAVGHHGVNAVLARLSQEIAVPVSRLVAAANRRATALGDLAAAAGDADLVAPELLADPDHAGDVAALDALDSLVAVATQHALRAPCILDTAARSLTAATAEHDVAAAELAAALAGVGLGDVAELHTAHGRAESERDVAASAVVAAERAVAEVARIDAVRDVLDPFVADLRVLAVALRDQHFVAHLVRAREAELLAEATRRLREITGGRFGFTAGFGVVNVASGEVRTPDTLSGGERFQAALALALGLVEIASRGGGRLDAVFVDEGFGSLDAGALDTALETLGKVAGGGKLVALISHLRPVAEYVDTVLHVTRDDVLGSRIEVLDSEAREQLLADDIRSGLTA
jgi:exonuclease SbcC